MVRRLNEYPVITEVEGNYTIPIMIDGTLKQVSVANLLNALTTRIAALEARVDALENSSDS